MFGINIYVKLQKAHLAAFKNLALINLYWPFNAKRMNCRIKKSECKIRNLQIQFNT